MVESLIVVASEDASMRGKRVPSNAMWDGTIVQAARGSGSGLRGLPGALLARVSATQEAFDARSRFSFIGSGGVSPDRVFILCLHSGAARPSASLGRAGALAC